MARGTTLVKLLDMYRAECRLSLNPAHNPQVRDTQINHIQRIQEWLWDDFDWPLLRVDRFIELQAGQRFYEPPSDMRIDRISKIEVWYDKAYRPLCPGIDAKHYTTYSSELGERQWPPQRYNYTEDEQIEVWPIPDQNFDPTTLEGRLKITGIRNLRPLVENADEADLDDRLMILYCAAETLAASGAKDAQFKQQQANARYAKLRGSQTARRKFKMFGIGDRDQPYRRIPIAVYNKPS